MTSLFSMKSEVSTIVTACFGSVMLLLWPNGALAKELVRVVNVDLNNGKDQASKEVVRLLRKKLSSRNPRKQVLALKLFERLVEDCGEGLHKQVHQRSLLLEIAKLGQSKKSSDAEVASLALHLVRSWGESVAPNSPGCPERPQFAEVYKEMLDRGVSFPSQVRSQALDVSSTARPSPVAAADCDGVVSPFVIEALLAEGIDHEHRNQRERFEHSPVEPSYLVPAHVPALPLVADGVAVPSMDALDSVVEEGQKHVAELSDLLSSSFPLIVMQGSEEDAGNSTDARPATPSAPSAVIQERKKKCEHSYAMLQSAIALIGPVGFKNNKQSMRDALVTFERLEDVIKTYEHAFPHHTAPTLQDSTPDIVEGIPVPHPPPAHPDPQHRPPSSPLQPAWSSNDRLRTGSAPAVVSVVHLTPGGAVGAVAADESLAGGSQRPRAQSYASGLPWPQGLLLSSARRSFDSSVSSMSQTSDSAASLSSSRSSKHCDWQRCQSQSFKDPFGCEDGTNDPFAETPPLQPISGRDPFGDDPSSDPFPSGPHGESSNDDDNDPFASDPFGDGDPFLGGPTRDPFEDQPPRDPFSSNSGAPPAPLPTRAQATPAGATPPTAATPESSKALQSAAHNSYIDDLMDIITPNINNRARKTSSYLDDLIDIVNTAADGPETLPDSGTKAKGAPPAAQEESRPPAKTSTVTRMCVDDLLDIVQPKAQAEASDAGTRKLGLQPPAPLTVRLPATSEGAIQCHVATPPFTPPALSPSVAALRHERKRSGDWADNGVSGPRHERKRSNGGSCSRSHSRECSGELANIANSLMRELQARESVRA